jgi:hypothetical protein
MICWASSLNQTDICARPSGLRARMLGAAWFAAEVSTGTSRGVARA